LRKNTMDNQCYECGFGKALDNNVCVGTLNCLKPEATCQACAGGFDLKSDGNCYDISDGCDKQGSTNGVCASCKTGYKMIGYRCVKQEVFVPYCYIYYNNTSCEICKNGYSFFQNYCLLPSHIQGILNGTTTIDATIAQIKADMGITPTTTTTSNQQTTTTTTPSNSNGNGNSNSNTPSNTQNPSNSQNPPTPSNTQSNQQTSTTTTTTIVSPSPTSTTTTTTSAPNIAIPYCANQQGNVCFSCVNGYVVSSNTCIPMDPNCSSYELSSGKCVACIPNY